MIFRLFCTLSQRGPNVLYRVALMMKPQVVFVLGGPGAGKGTQCSKIVEVRPDETTRERTMKRIENDNYDSTGHCECIVSIDFGMILSVKNGVTLILSTSGCPLK